MSRPRQNSRPDPTAAVTAGKVQRSGDDLAGPLALVGA